MREHAGSAIMAATRARCGSCAGLFKSIVVGARVGGRLLAEAALFAQDETLALRKLEVGPALVVGL